MEKVNQQGYTEAFKLHVVKEVESGIIRECEARRKYGILGHSTILKWCRKYGNKPQLTGAKEMPDKDFEMKRQANEIKALKEELDESRFKNMVLETLIDVAEEELSIDIRKKRGAKRSVK